MPAFRNAVIAAAGTFLLAAASLPNSHGPLPGHTGGFGEPTCLRCHSDYSLNEPGATIELDSLPAFYEPERRYPLQLRLGHPELKRGGFQLTARFENGSPAGHFEIADTTLLRIQRGDSIEYLSHNLRGTAASGGGSVAWKFIWVAPRSDRKVLFHTALNAANDDASEFGDRIFTAQFSSGSDAVRK